MNKLEFNANYCASTSIRQQTDKVLVYLSDDLSVIETSPNLPVAYESKIYTIIKGSASWFEKSINKIKDELPQEEEIQLTSLYILSEPNIDPLIFGLEFWVSSDEEHGRGMKLRSDTMEIIEYGLGDVAFC